MNEPGAMIDRVMCSPARAVETPLPACPEPSSWLLRWSGSMSRWSKQSATLGCGEHGGESVDLMIALEIREADCLMVEAWLELDDGRRRPILDRQAARSALCLDNGLWHIDARLDDGGTIAFTLDADEGRLLYARSSILERTGLTTGSFDPPGLVG